MKAFIGTSVFVSLLLLFFFLFGYDAFEKEVHYDDEQEGLNEQIVINFSHVVAENTPKGLAAQKFAEIVTQKSNGRVQVEVFPNGALYSDDEEISALKRNDVQMIAPSFSKMNEIMPEWQMFDLPFIFESYDEVEQVFMGDVGQKLLTMLEEEDLKGLALWSNGFKQMTSNKSPLLEPDDFKGQSFRIMPSKVIEEQFQLLGAQPRVVPFNQVYASLQKHEFDGQENTISNIYSKRFYQLQRYMTISNHGYLGYTVLMSEGFWKRLPPDVQRIIEEAMKETTTWILEQSKSMNEQQLTHIQKESNIKVYYLTEDEKEKWRQKLQPIYEQFEEEATEELIEMIKQFKRVE
ncbi:DctP family TRAP transporter solute-binding subunit [Priestia abyssalis]|uniref:DctP family TRAP transporter solute-binding subunit n=1 Tax=Priestia abyssalis TaxID=1221450 RepID=UPI00099494E2|nr:DctP family TRAP transporter solute-binding subunit [Priestia abyssalis]